MCGIAGLIARNPNLGATELGVMTDAMARRGPDSEGRYQFAQTWLGHRRLSIFDLSAAGHQPMVTDDGKIGLVFNGAIYNFHALRKELEQRGCRFKSQTDTEVLLLGYREWGIDALARKIDGMFAFAVWDHERGTLFMVRDRLGVKPLYYVNNASAFAFASSARALHAAGLCDELNPDAVAEFLEYGYVGESHSIYAGMQKVLPATILEVRGDAITSRSYWQLESPRNASLSFRDASAAAEELLIEATRKRLLADVPVGALLSGGIDSALVCWAIKHLGADITAYSVAVPGDPTDEGDDAIATAREIGIGHQVLPMSALESSAVDDLVGAYGEPFACASALGMLRLSQAISQSPAKVLLTGDGGDDAFLGYERHRMLLNVQQRAQLLPGAATSIWTSLRDILPHQGAAKRAKHFIDYHVGGLGAFVSANDGLPRLRSLGVLGPRLLDRVVPARKLPWSMDSARSLLQQYLDYDLGHQFVSEYLTKVDGATMFYALEARSPFLDVAMWEFAGRQPYGTLLQNGTLKALLRDIATRRISPRLAVGRKRGFSIPVERWVAGRWGQAVQDAFANSTLVESGWISERPLLADLDHARRAGVAPTRLWYLYVLESWLRYESARNEALV